jgi:hypothetical protein
LKEVYREKKDTGGGRQKTILLDNEVLNGRRCGTDIFRKATKNTIRPYKKEPGVKSNGK